MKSYVINVPRHTERLAEFSALWHAPFPFEVVKAIDGTFCVVPRRWQHQSAAYGLFASYLNIFSAVRARGFTEPFAVFEDDALLHKEWWAYVERALKEAPLGWWSINLGADIVVPGYLTAPTIVSPHLARLPHGWRTHAVIYNPAVVPLMVDAMNANLIPVDQVWCARMLAGSESFYCTRSFLAGARAGTSTITGIRWAGAFVGPFGLGGPQHGAL